MEENIFPGQRSVGNPRLLEEERRLLYVAITRAEKHCYLTCAKTRYRYGHTEYDVPSRFLKDIDSAYLHIASEANEPLFETRSTFKSCGEQSFGDFAGGSFSGSAASRRSGSPIPSTVLSVPRSAMDVPRRPGARAAVAPSSCGQTSRQQFNNITVGAKIVHQRFGHGEILRIDGEGENTKATVRFDEVGVKQLLVKFARFEVVK